MSKLDKNQRIRTSKPKQDFDMSHDYLFTATTGQLRPVTHDFVQAGDYVKGKFNFFLRTMPLSTAAMVDVDFLVDYFFVPMDLLWLPFGAWWSQTRSFALSPGSVYAGNSQVALDDFPVMKFEHVDALIDEDSPSYDRDEYYQSLRLLDDLGFSGVAFQETNAAWKNDGDGHFPQTPYFFPWQFAAYQCIYQHFYRNDEREAFDSSKYHMEDGEITNGAFLTELVKMRYLNRMDDYFTASKLSPLVANINNNPSFLGDFDVNLGLNDFHLESAVNDSYDPLYTNSAPTNAVNTGITESSDNNDSSRAINQLRALFAEEKLMHVMNMTNKNYDAQVLARLGYDVPKDVKHEIVHLGHDTCQLNIQEIVSGSNTFTGETGSALGDLAGQGKAISKGFKGFSFTAPCHGVVMTIWTCRTRPKYTVSQLRKDSLAEITDFFTPELDDLGMQPQYLYETRLNSRLIVPQVGGSYTDYVYTNPYTIVGWNYRYEYLKRNINRASLAFMRGDDGNGQQYGMPVNRPDDPSRGFNSYSQWSSARIPLDNALRRYGSSVSDDPVYVFEDDYYTRPHNSLYKVRPNELDNVMLVSWLTAPALIPDPESPGHLIDAEDWKTFPWLAYQRDPFIVDGRFECHKRSAMSLYSMPKFI